MERYEKLEIIENRGSVEVCKYKDLKSDDIVAIKRIPFHDKSEGVPCEVIQEISMLKELDHDNVVRLIDVVAEEDGFYLVFEHSDLDLATFIHNQSNTEVDPHLIKSFLFQILQGVFYCHSQNILLQDLKSDCFLIDSRRNTVKLGHYGFFRTVDVPSLKYSGEVAPLYRAPELLSGTPYSSKVDTWAVGCIFAEMVEKRARLSGACVIRVMIEIFRTGVVDVENGPGPASTYPKVPRPCKNLSDMVPGIELEGLDLLSKMMCIDPKRRIPVRDALRHPFFSDFQEKNSCSLIICGLLILVAKLRFRPLSRS